MVGSVIPLAGNRMYAQATADYLPQHTFYHCCN